jgi:hypothetical protein
MITTALSKLIKRRPWLNVIMNNYKHNSYPLANMTRTFKLSLLVIFIIQLVMIGAFELAHDEAYYWLYSKHLDWGYFDHPPFVAVIIKLFSFFPHGEFSIRIGFVVLQMASLLLLISLTSRPWTVFLLFFSFPLASVSGLLAIPDTPLLFMTAVYCWMLKKYLVKDEFSYSLGLGLIIALLLYAKYHGILLIFFTLLAVPKIFLRRSFYLVTIVAIIGFFPHLFWQYKHDFSTLRYHFIERPSSAFSISRVIEYLGLQVGLAGLFVGPITWFIIFKHQPKNEFDRSLKFISVGVVVFFLLSSFSKKTEANWTIFLTIPLIILASESDIWKKRIPHIFLIGSFLTILLTRFLFLTSPEITGIKRLKEFHGWRNWTRDIQNKCEERLILANTYQIASKLSFYLNREIGALNYHSRKNQFDYWSFEGKSPTNKVCYITDKKEFQGEHVETPDGKILKIVKNQSLEMLWELKSIQR